MTDEFNYEEAIHAVLETRTALERAQACVDRLERMLGERPRSFGPAAQAAFRLRDRLIGDLGTLEARLAQVNAGPASGGELSGPGGREAPRQDPDAPLGDRVALGGQ
jgi:hypothetical protein